MLEKCNYKKNCLINIPDGPINGQGLPPVCSCRFGLFPASYNSCEMIALYNLLVINGIKDFKFSDICLDMYKKVGVLCGLFGSNVYKLHKFFIEYNIRYIKTKNRNSFFRLLNINRTGIISFWNTNNPLDGVHTVCIEKIQDRYKIYNRSNKRSYPCTYRNIDDIVSDKRFMVGYVKIENAENIKK